MNGLWGDNYIKVRWWLEDQKSSSNGSPVNHSKTSNAFYCELALVWVSSRKNSMCDTLLAEWIKCSGSQGIPRSSPVRTSCWWMRPFTCNLSGHVQNQAEEKRQSTHSVRKSWSLMMEIVFLFLWMRLPSLFICKLLNILSCSDNRLYPWRVEWRVVWLHRKSCIWNFLFLTKLNKLQLL